MRSPLNTIIFESCLDNTTPGTDLENAFQRLYSPRVPISEEACNTYLGERLAVNLDLLGRTELTDNVAIDMAHLNEYSGYNELIIPVRSLSTCIAPNGVCVACYMASRPGLTPPSVGDTINIFPEYVIQRDHIPVATGTTVVPLSYDVSQYSSLYVFQDGTINQVGVDYTVSGSTLTFTTGTLPDGGSGSISTITIWYASETRCGFMYWLADTYSGSLMGLSPLPFSRFPVRKSLFTSLLPPGDVFMLTQNVLQSPLIPDPIKSYVPQITDIMEQTVLVSALNAIYGLM